MVLPGDVKLWQGQKGIGEENSGRRLREGWEEAKENETLYLGGANGRWVGREGKGRE